MNGISVYIQIYALLIIYIYTELGSIADTVSIKAKNQYRRYI